MNKIHYLAGLMILMFTLTGCASDARHHQASMPDPDAFNAHFGEMDTDGSEGVSWEEFKGHFPQATREIYQELDLNRDNMVDHDEWHAFKEAHGLGHVE